MSVFIKRDRLSQIPLPYMILNYIQSTGTQYIDTSFIPNQNTRVVMDAQLLNTATTVALFGSRTSATSNNLGVYYASGRKRLVADYKTSSNRYEIETSPTERMIIDYNKNQLTIGSETHTFPTATFTCPGSLMLCAVYSGSSVSLIATMRLYACQIYDNDVLIRDYIPVQLKETEEIGLWDKVENKFHGNAGTGTFISDKVVDT